MKKYKLKINYFDHTDEWQYKKEDILRLSPDRDYYELEGNEQYSLFRDEVERNPDIFEEIREQEKHIHEHKFIYHYDSNKHLAYITCRYEECNYYEGDIEVLNKMKINEKSSPLINSMHQKKIEKLDLWDEEILKEKIDEIIDFINNLFN